MLSVPVPAVSLTCRNCCADTPSCGRRCCVTSPPQVAQRTTKTPSPSETVNHPVLASRAVSDTALAGARDPDRLQHLRHRLHRRGRQLAVLRARLCGPHRGRHTPPDRDEGPGGCQRGPQGPGGPAVVRERHAADGYAVGLPEGAAERVRQPAADAVCRPAGAGSAVVPASAWSCASGAVPSQLWFGLDL